MLRLNEWNTKNVDFTCQTFSGSILDDFYDFLPLLLDKMTDSLLYFETFT